MTTMYSSENILESEDDKLYWAEQYYRDQTVLHYRPDNMLVKKRDEITFLIDISVPNDANILQEESEKIKNIHTWQLNYKNSGDNNK